MDSTDELQSKERRCNLKDQSAGGLECLPQEILLDIFSRLPISSVLQLKFVCRGWRNLARDPHFTKMHISHMAKSNPCLIFYSNQPIEKQLYFVDLYARRDKEAVVKKIYPQFSTVMPKFEVIGSCNGLLCLCDPENTHALFICNPFTRDYKELPKGPELNRDHDVIFGFGCHPTTKEYKVIRIINYRNRYRAPRCCRFVGMQTEVQVLTVGDVTWRSLGECPYLLLNWSSPVLVNGRLHWVTWPVRYGPKHMLVSFDLADEQFREVPRPECGALDMYRYNLFLLRGCLSAAVIRYYRQVDIWVMKEYDVKESWVKEIRIGTYVPRALEESIGEKTFGIQKRFSNGPFLKILCLLETGEYLLEYENRTLVSYDPRREVFNDLKFQGLPESYGIVVHFGSLTSEVSLFNV
ncbi:F-box protein At3g07870-like [Carica papaya]|uniref:F-box protein At3g07870-like n=1 Tax=Carica papaya TaxID=3649 RepID=UPI000B8CDD8C|nr:F-box protein At3g07870-like [Carica papaya]